MPAFAGITVSAGRWRGGLDGYNVTIEELSRVEIPHRVAEVVVETGMIEGALALAGRAPLVGAPLAEVTFEGEASQEEEGPQVVAQIGN